MRSSLDSLITRMMLLCVIPLLLAVYIAGARVHEINAESQRRAGQVAECLQAPLDGHLSAGIAGRQTLADSPLADPPPCCAGSTRRSAWSRRRASSRWQRKTISSSSLAAG